MLEVAASSSPTSIKLDVAYTVYGHSRRRRAEDQAEAALVC